MTERTKRRIRQAVHVEIKPVNGFRRYRLFGERTGKPKKRKK